MALLYTTWGLIQDLKPKRGDPNSYFNYQRYHTRREDPNYYFNTR